jgi:hypothetical protein
MKSGEHETRRAAKLPTSVLYDTRLSCVVGRIFGWEILFTTLADQEEKGLYRFSASIGRTLVDAENSRRTWLGLSCWAAVEIGLILMINVYPDQAEKEGSDDEGQTESAG